MAGKVLQTFSMLQYKTEQTSDETKTKLEQNWNLNKTETWTKLKLEQNWNLNKTTTRWIVCYSRNIEIVTVAKRTVSSYGPYRVRVRSRSVAVPYRSRSRSRTATVP